jgi:hypothetical protein
MSPVSRRAPGPRATFRRAVRPVGNGSSSGRRWRLAKKRTRAGGRRRGVKKPARPCSTRATVGEEHTGRPSHEGRHVGVHSVPGGAPSAPHTGCDLAPSPRFPCLTPSGSSWSSCTAGCATMRMTTARKRTSRPRERPSRPCITRCYGAISTRGSTASSTPASRARTARDRRSGDGADGAAPSSTRAMARRGRRSSA